MDDKFQATLTKRLDLEAAGYKVIEMWGCQLDEELGKDPEMKAYFKSIFIPEPMDPRDALYGGRTNATKLYHKFKNGEKGLYSDYNSLYPATCAFDAFPIGHATQITENFEPINQNSEPYKGLIKCKILPPRRLLHPLLPYRSKKKTLFPLCRTCADQRNKKTCHHRREERALIGNWPHMEVYKAVQLGYEILEIYHVYHWDEWIQLNGEEQGLFTAFIRLWLKLKTEATGWPSWVQTEKDRRKYVRDFAERLGIDLDPEKIKKNKALRALAKLFLNR